MLALVAVGLIGSGAALRWVFGSTYSAVSSEDSIDERVAASFSSRFSVASEM